MLDQPFDPWRAIAERDDVVLSFHPVARLMGGGFYARAGELGIIVVDPDLPGEDRRAVLTHELIHHERGGEVPDDPSARTASFIAGDERSVDREVARRLVPAPLLDQFVRASVRAAIPVGPIEVADQFEVPLDVASRALDQYRRRPPPHHRP